MGEEKYFLGQRKRATIYKTFEAAGGKYPGNFIKFIPDKILANRQIGAETIAETMKRFYDFCHQFQKIEITVKPNNDELDEVITLREAADILGVSPGFMANYACQRGDVKNGHFRAGEIRKSGGTWLIKKDALRRLFPERNI